jgi:transposase
MMKIQEVIFRAIAKKLTWWQAAEVLGISDKTMMRWRHSYETRGYDPRFWGRSSSGESNWTLVPLGTAEKALSLYQEKYSHLDVAQFREKLSKEHNIQLTSAWIKLALEGAGLLAEDVRVSGVAADSAGIARGDEVASLKREVVRSQAVTGKR